MVPQTPESHPPLRGPKTRSLAERAVWSVLGSLFLALGAIGVVVPGLPTTPFILLATACFARSSERMTRYLLNHRLFGRLIQDYRAGRGIPFRAKLLALFTMGAFSAFAVGPGLPAELFWPRIAVLAAAITGGIVVLRIPTRK